MKKNRIQKNWIRVAMPRCFILKFLLWGHKWGKYLGTRTPWFPPHPPGITAEIGRVRAEALAIIRFQWWFQGGAGETARYERLNICLSLWPQSKNIKMKHRGTAILLQFFCIRFFFILTYQKGVSSLHFYWPFFVSCQAPLLIGPNQQNCGQKRRKIFDGSRGARGNPR